MSKRRLARSLALRAGLDSTRADYVIRQAPALRVQPAAPTASQLRSRESHGAGGIVEIELCCLTAGAERARRASDIDDCAIDGRYRTRNGDTGRRDWIGRAVRKVKMRAAGNRHVGHCDARRNLKPDEHLRAAGR